MIYVTNGCFDMLHEGHRHFFRELTWHMDSNDSLCVYVNSDKSVQKLKGMSRPIIPEERRVEELTKFIQDLLKPSCCLYCIKLSDDPEASLRVDRTENVSHSVVYVKDVESGINGPEARWAVERGFSILSIPRLPGVSTTDIINRVLHATHQGSST